MMFCLCIFERDTVKIDCPIQILRKNVEIFKDLIQIVCLPYLASFTVCSGDI